MTKIDTEWMAENARDILYSIEYDMCFCSFELLEHNYKRMIEYLNFSKALFSDRDFTTLQCNAKRLYDDIKAENREA